MSQRLMKMYKDRLASFTETLNYLHDIVGVDEALAYLKDERLIQHKIDRIEEIVRDVLSSEKQKIIIELIMKIQAMENKEESDAPRPIQVEQAMDQTQMMYFRKRLQQKNQELQKMKTQLDITKQQCEEQKRLLNQQKMQFQIYQNRHKEIKQRLEMMEEQKNLEAKTQNDKKQGLAALNKKLQEEVIRLAEAERSGKSMQNELKDVISRLQAENERLRSQIQSKRDLSSRQKTERIQTLKKEIRKLNFDLSETKEMIKIIHHHTASTLSRELRILKDQLSELSAYANRGLKSIFKDIHLSYQTKPLPPTAPKSQPKEETMIDQIQKSDELMKRMDTLQDQLNRFIQQKLI